MKKLLAAFIIYSISAMVTSLKAQVYNSAIGINTNSLIGITYKKFIDKPNDTSKLFKSWEIHAGFKLLSHKDINKGLPILKNKLSDNKAYGLDVFYVYNTVLSSSFMFNYGYGAGLALPDMYYGNQIRHKGLTLAAAGKIGIEYVMKNAPLAFEASSIVKLSPLYAGQLALAFEIYPISIGIKYIIN